jgi:diguanylate cyclase (GGDEF)-like protein
VVDEVRSPGGAPDASLTVRERLIRSMVLSATEGMVAVGVDGTVLVANHAAEGLTGPLSVGNAIWEVEGLESMRFVLESWEATGGPPAVTLELPRGPLLDLGVSGFPAGPPLEGFLLNVRENRYTWLATHDARTSLLNREAFLDRMDQLPEQGGGAVVLIDIDGLRLINHQCGNRVGDSVLVLVARAIAATVPENGVAARFDGDQFVVLLPGTPLRMAQDIVERVLGRIRQIQEVRDVTVSVMASAGGAEDTDGRIPGILRADKALAAAWDTVERVLGRNQPIPEVREIKVSVTASAGVAQLTDGRFPDILRADKALAAAKAQGRDRQVTYGPDIQDWAHDRRSLMTWMHEMNGENARLWEESRTDALTQLPNYRAFEEAEELLADARYPVGVLFIDLDRFGEYNHRYGDAAGDAILKAVSARMAGCLREEDLTFRKGGEEFISLLPGVDAPTVAAAGERLRQAVELLGLEHAGNDGGLVTVTVGCAHTDDVGDLRAARNRAARAVYDAKERDERNRVT